MFLVLHVTGTRVCGSQVVADEERGMGWGGRVSLSSLSPPSLLPLRVYPKCLSSLAPPPLLIKSSLTLCLSLSPPPPPPPFPPQILFRYMAPLFVRSSMALLRSPLHRRRARQLAASLSTPILHLQYCHTTTDTHTQKHTHTYTQTHTDTHTHTQQHRAATCASLGGRKSGLEGSGGDLLNAISCAW
jgi:hypothetical protein